MENFKNKLYITKSVEKKIPKELIFLIIKLIQNLHKETKVDYLQIIKIRNNILIHKQEIPKYRKGYVLPISISSCKLFVIDNGDYSTLMFNYEY